jgi:signal transduction histidine kinase
VSDDGCGLDPNATPGVGLSSMRERAEGLGGTLAVAEVAPSGTRVQARIPIDVLEAM